MRQAGFENQIVIRTDLKEKCEGYIVIDTTFANRSVGGLRIADDIFLEEVKVLAREMTLKYSFIGFSRGGAKSGLRIPAGSTLEKKRSLLFQFGKHLKPIIRSGLYLPWMDINCDAEDLRILYTGAGLGNIGFTDSSFFTAISTYNAIAAVRDFLGNPSQPLHLAIEGFGSVAKWFAQMLPEDQYIITAISTIKGAAFNEDGFNGKELVYKQECFGDELINHLKGKRADREGLLSAQVDILIPSARVWSISEEVASSVRARFVVPIANAPYKGNGTTILESKGIVCLPGFVVNSGGVFGSSLYDVGVPRQEIERVSTKYFRDIVRSLLHVQSRYGTSAVLLAEDVAHERLSRRVNSVNPGNGYLYRAKELSRNILVPKNIRRRMYLRRFIGNLIELKYLILEHRETACTPMMNDMN